MQSEGSHDYLSNVETKDICPIQPDGSNRALSVKLDKLLTVLSDSAWHNSDEVAKALEIPQDRLQHVITFLIRSDLVEHNAETNQIKLTQNWKTLILNQTEASPETEVQSSLEIKAVGTIIIPPKKTLIIQCTRITNLTDSNLELEIRMDRRVDEIAINQLK